MIAIDTDWIIDEARIERIARAMCRSARKNPDDRVFRPSQLASGAVDGGHVPAWFTYRESAEQFVMSNRSVADRL